MGRPRKPNALKKAQGTYRKDRDPAVGGVEAPVGLPPMPPGLPPAAKRRWNEIVPQLHGLGTLAVIDGGAVEAYCRAFARWLKLEKMADAGPTSDAAVEARKLHKEVIQPLELALGLHYAARNRVKMPAKPKEEDPVEKDLFGGGLQVVEGGKTV
jgi:phage terminase small subunit